MKILLKLRNSLTAATHAIAGLTRYAGKFNVDPLSPKAALAARMVDRYRRLAACRR